MALWVCNRCGCKFAVGLDMCPQCTSIDVEADVPKVSKNQGPSYGPMSEGPGGSNSDAFAPVEIGEPVEDTEQDGDEDEPVERSSYYDMSKADLKELAAERALSSTGNKQDLIDVLEEDDLEQATAPDPE